MNQQLKHPIFVSNDEHKGTHANTAAREGFVWAVRNFFSYEL